MQNDMQKLSLELTLYGLCGGAFALFVRWMQDQIAFDEEGLPTGGFWNVCMIALILVAAVVFYRFTDELKQRHYHGEKDFCAALKNEGRIYMLLRIALGALMSVGGMILIAATRTDREAKFLLALGITAVASGIAFPVLLGSANRPDGSRFRGVCALMPVIMCALWLITIYKINAISSVIWGYGMQVICVGVAMFSFFRVAGFVFEMPETFKSIFSCLFGTFMCLLAVADENYLGIKIMLVAAAGMLSLYNWILIANLRKGKAPEVKPVNDGFERL